MGPHMQISSHEDLVNDTSSSHENQQLVQYGECTELCNSLNDGVYKYFPEDSGVHKYPPISSWEMSIDCKKLSEDEQSKLSRAFQGAKYHYTVTLKGVNGTEEETVVFESGAVRPAIAVATYDEPDFSISLDADENAAKFLPSLAGLDASPEKLPWRLFGIYQITNSIAKKTPGDKGPQVWTWREEGRTGYKLPTLYLDYHRGRTVETKHYAKTVKAELATIEFNWYHSRV